MMTLDMNVIDFQDKSENPLSAGEYRFFFNTIAQFNPDAKIKRIYCLGGLMMITWMGKSKLMVTSFEFNYGKEDGTWFLKDHVEIKHRIRN
jgi:hypothetical protein